MSISPDPPFLEVNMKQIITNDSTNIDMKMKDGKLIITINMKKRYGMLSEKSTLIASTHGNALIGKRNRISIHGKYCSY